MVSLAQKDVTQATIVRKLSSYARQNQTKKALWELENICRTLYILDFIDDVELRQSVQKALNRGEAYHFCVGPRRMSMVASFVCKPRLGSKSGMSALDSSPTPSFTTTLRCCHACMNKNRLRKIRQQ